MGCCDSKDTSFSPQPAPPPSTNPPSEPDFSDFTWVQSSTYQGIPGNAVHAGNDQDGSPIYVGRARHQGDLLVAKVIPSKQAAYVAYNSQEIFVGSYEVLVGHGFQWVGSGNGHVPDNAVIAGHTSNGEPLYVGRGKHNKLTLTEKKNS